MFDDSNEDNGIPPEGSGFPFGGMFPIRLPASMVEHARAQTHNIAREKRVLVDEQIRLYNELVESANLWNAQIGEPLLTLEVCAAGIVRNGICRRVSQKIGQFLHEFDPLEAHEYMAKHYEHTAMCERWEARMGALTGTEHSHAPAVATTPPDDR